MTNDEIRAALTEKGWTEVGAKAPVEDYQQKSYWYSSDPSKSAVHLQLVEDLTETQKEPKLSIYSERDRWIPIKIEDLT